VVAGGSRAVFLDRDGVLTVPEFRDGRSYAPRRLADYHLYDDASACLQRLKAAGFSLVVVTNQPDVGYGLVDLAVVEEMHRRLAAALPVDAIKVCYHRQSDGCDCRKPKPGMLCAAAAELAIDCSRSFMIGDRGSDIEAGRSVGCIGILIDLGYREELHVSPEYRVSSLPEATEIVLAHR
jgi:D-glycero-D-manno-heptose 1,7-bisphosphate phosphatase